MASQKQVAEHLGISTRRVRELEAEGIIPKRTRGGGYDLTVCRLAVLEHLRSLASGRGGRSQEDLAAQRGQLAAAQRAKIELQTRILRHEYVLTTEAARQLDQVMQIAREHFATLGVRTVPDLLVLIDSYTGPALAGAMAEAVQRRTDDAMSVFQDFNASGALAELLAPTTTEAAK